MGRGLDEAMTRAEFVAETAMRLFALPENEYSAKEAVSFAQDLAVILEQTSDCPWKLTPTPACCCSGQPPFCQDQQATGLRLVCTRSLNHDGPHIACAVNRHLLAEWT